MKLPSKKEDISKWYERVVSLSGLASPGLVKGTLFIHHKGWHIWESIQRFLNFEFTKKTIKNVSFPSLIPISAIEKEKKKLNGFEPETYYVSNSRDTQSFFSFLRPTSEILFSVFFKRILNSYDQLPLIFNQWCNVYRSEKNTKAFLRSCEFYWQEIHAIFESSDDALDYVYKIHEIYKKVMKNLLNISCLEGEKTIGERFIGSNKTLALEAIMPDGQCLQVSTSHYLSTNFSSMFEIKYTDKNNSCQNPHQISAGTSTRLIGATILDHGDDRGLVLPIGIVDVQIKILVINSVLNKNDDKYLEIRNQLDDFLVEWDFSSKSLGYRLNQEELLGTPFLVIIGKQEMETEKVLVKSRLSEEKEYANISELKDYFLLKFDFYSDQLFNRSKVNMEAKIVSVNTLEEAKTEILKNCKVVLVPWLDDEFNEEKFKSENFGFGPRCIKERIYSEDVKCFYSGNKANAYVYFGRSY